MGAVPGVVEVRGLTERRLVEGQDDSGRGVRIGVAGVGLGLERGLALGVELAQVVIGRTVLLHEHHDVLHRIALGLGSRRAADDGKERRNKGSRDHQHPGPYSHAIPSRDAPARVCCVQSSVAERTRQATGDPRGRDCDV